MAGFFKARDGFFCFSYLLGILLLMSCINILAVCVAMLQFLTEAIRNSFPSPRIKHGNLPPLVPTRPPFQLLE